MDNIKTSKPKSKVMKIIKLFSALFLLIFIIWLSIFYYYKKNSDHCQNECSKDRCKLECGGLLSSNEANGLGCVPVCVPKKCYDFKSENCPKIFCRIKTSTISTGATYNYCTAYLLDDVFPLFIIK